jgi:cobalamin biosynthesis Mg chelatase CobN
MTDHDQLAHLARAYFHEDYDLEEATPLEVVRTFQRGEPPDAVAGLISDLEAIREAILNSHMSENEIRELWIRTYGASYDPRDDGKSYREWFAEALSTLTAP